MNLVEATGILTWLSQTDGRVLLTEPNVQVWGNALQPVTFEEAKAAVLDHYRSNDTVASPSGIRRAALAIRDRAVAKQTALTAGPVRPDVTEKQIRQRVLDTPAFRAAFDRGVAERATRFPKGA